MGQETVRSVSVPLLGKFLSGRLAAPSDKETLLADLPCPQNVLISQRPSIIGNTVYNAVVKAGPAH